MVCQGDGRCFFLNGAGLYEQKPCDKGCMLKTCRRCYTPFVPHWILEKNHGFCERCDGVYCIYCEGRLVPIGRARVNGKQTHADWDGRREHKQCWIRHH